MKSSALIFTLVILCKSCELLPCEFLSNRVNNFYFFCLFNMYVCIYVLYHDNGYICIYIYNIIYIYIIYIYIIYNIYNIYIYVYQKDKEIKPSYQILREFHVNVRTNIQPVLNELTSRYTYGMADFSSRQCKVFWSYASLKVSSKNSLSSNQVGLTEK